MDRVVNGNLYVFVSLRLDGTLRPRYGLKTQPPIELDRMLHDLLLCGNVHIDTCYSTRDNGSLEIQSFLQKSSCCTFLMHHENSPEILLALAFDHPDDGSLKQHRLTGSTSTVQPSTAGRNPEYQDFYCLRKQVCHTAHTELFFVTLIVFVIFSM